MTLLSTKDALVLIGEKMIDPAMHAVAGGMAAVYSTTSPDKETMNEDAAAIIPIDDRSAVFAVADGLGGTRLGGEAARCAIKELRKALVAAVDNGTELQSAILNGIEQANAAILDLGTGAATTIAVAELCGDTVRPYHVGDSVILVFGQRGKIKMQTVAHSPVGFALEAGMLNEKEAMHHEDRHIVSNVIGAADTRIEIGMPLQLAARDTLLLASDGLMDNLHVSEVVSRLRKGPITDAADALVKDTQNRMIKPKEGKPSHPDDLTFVAYRQTTAR